MSKIFGASIACRICGAQPFPCCELVRETFDLIKVNPATGKASGKGESSGKDEWRCERHRRDEASAKPAKPAKLAKPAAARADAA